MDSPLDHRVIFLKNYGRNPMEIFKIYSKSPSDFNSLSLHKVFQFFEKDDVLLGAH